MSGSSLVPEIGLCSQCSASVEKQTLHTVNTDDIDELVQERGNFIANALTLRFSSHRNILDASGQNASDNARRLFHNQGAM